MSLKLYYHPLSSFCHKALIALYERDIPYARALQEVEPYFNLFSMETKPRLPKERA
jgi:glutathione S-transferase